MPRENYLNIELWLVVKNQHKRQECLRFAHA